jgi:hypothetical protein
MFYKPRGILLYNKIQIALECMMFVKYIVNLKYLLIFVGKTKKKKKKKTIFHFFIPYHFSP